MAEEKKIFFPLFYNALDLTESLSNEEFGRLIRELLKSGGRKEYTPMLESKLMLAYCFMLDAAIRIFNTYTKKKSYGGGRGDSKREYNFDADEALELALARSYAESEKEKSEEA